MQIKTFFKNLLQKNRRQKLTMLAAAFVVYVCLLTGIFSYFHGRDAVTNRLTAQNGSVTIREPEWDRTGQKMAANAEPGMQIPKDPYGYNDGEINIYVRLKLTVKFNDYQGPMTKKTSQLTEEEIANGEIGKPSDEERVAAILGAIRLVDDNDIATPFATWNGTAWESENEDFVCRTGEASALLHTYTFYYYYVETGTDTMQAVAPNEVTSELFQRVDIPVYKKDYLGVFDQPYTISVQAQGIPVGDSVTLTVDDAADSFENG